jgi:hypothetical protein
MGIGLGEESRFHPARILKDGVVSQVLLNRCFEKDKKWRQVAFEDADLNPLLASL